MSINTNGFICLFDKCIPLYGMCAVLGFLISLFFLYCEARKNNGRFDDYIYLYITIILGIIIGAKTLFIIINIPNIYSDYVYAHESASFIFQKYTRGGMVFYGGMIGGIISAMLSVRIYHFDVKRIIPKLTPACILLATFGRLGCLFTGCCYGCKTSGRLWLTYSHSFYAPNNIKLVPTQLIEIIFDLTILVFILAIKKDFIKNNQHLVFISSYAIFRFFLEFYRGDEYRGFIAGLSISQWISLLIIIIIILYINKKRGIFLPCQF